MQPLQQFNNNIPDPSQFIDENLSNLLLERKDSPRKFLIEHPEMIGIIKKDDLIVFDNDSFFSDLFYVLNDSDVNREEHVCSFFTKKPIDDCLIMIDKLINIDGWWEILDKVISSLSPEKAEALKEISILPNNLKEASFSQIVKMIIAFPKIDWMKALWNEDIYSQQNRKMYSYMEYWDDHDKKKPLYVYSHLNGKTSKVAENDLSQLFEGAHTFFNNTIFRKLPTEQKKIIYNDIFLSAYPFAKAPQIFQMFDKYRTKIEKNMNIKITRLAFRAYRHNNGLWDKKYKKSQIKDVTQMFLECLTEKSVTYNSSVWRAFIDIIGENQGHKPQLKMSDIKHAISIAQHD